MPKKALDGIEGRLCNVGCRLPQCPRHGADTVDNALDDIGAKPVPIFDDKRIPQLRGSGLCKGPQLSRQPLDNADNPRQNASCCAQYAAQHAFKAVCHACDGIAAQALQRRGQVCNCIFNGIEYRCSCGLYGTDHACDAVFEHRNNVAAKADPVKCRKHADNGLYNLGDIGNQRGDCLYQPQPKRYDNMQPCR